MHGFKRFWGTFPEKFEARRVRNKVPGIYQCKFGGCRGKFLGTGRFQEKSREGSGRFWIRSHIEELPSGF